MTFLYKKQAHLDHTTTKSKHVQAPDAGDSRVDLEHLSHVGGTLSFHVVVVEAVGRTYADGQGVNGG